MFEQLGEQIFRYGLESKINLKGPIYDSNTLNSLLAESILSFSPKQAGLSVLQSMSVGVPFVTTKNAITGGEILNISDTVNGIILDSEKDMNNVLVDAMENFEKYNEMSLRAYEYYISFRTPKVMAKGIIDCIKLGAL